MSYIRHALSFVLALTLVVSVGPAMVSAQHDASTSDSDNQEEVNADEEEEVDEMPSAVDRLRQAADNIRTQRDAEEPHSADLESASENRSDRANEARSAVQEGLREIFQHRLNLTVRRFRAAITRISNIADRVESRMEKANEDGIDTGDVAEHLSSVRTHLAEAEFSVDAAAAVVPADDTPQAIREAIAEIKEYLFQARESIRAAHEALRNAFQSLREAIVDVQSSTESDEDSDEGDES